MLMMKKKKEKKKKGSYKSELVETELRDRRMGRQSRDVG